MTDGGSNHETATDAFSSQHRTPDTGFQTLAGHTAQRAKIAHLKHICTPYKVYTFLELVELDGFKMPGPFTYLVNMSPVLPMVVQTFPDHAHNFRKGDVVVSEVGDLGHERARRSPGIV